MSKADGRCRICGGEVPPTNDNKFTCSEKCRIENWRRHHPGESEPDWDAIPRVVYEAVCEALGDTIDGLGVALVEDFGKWLGEDGHRMKYRKKPEPVMKLMACEWCEEPATYRVKARVNGEVYRRFACGRDDHRGKTDRLVLLDLGDRVRETVINPTCFAESSGRMLGIGAGLEDVMTEKDRWEPPYEEEEYDVVFREDDLE